MKHYFKNMWVSYVLALAISFMFFIVEPIVMYSNNIKSFWFNLKMITPSYLTIFLITFLLIIIVNNIIFFINKKVNSVFNIITFICFLCSYIQGNFLASNLPTLNGAAINWSSFKMDSIISIMLWIIVIIISIIFIKEYSIKNYIKVSGYISLAIIFMLSTSLVTTFLTTDVLNSKKSEVLSITTHKNINRYSSNENFIILLVDAVDSKAFYKTLENNPYMFDVLKDFTYYPDTMSMDPYTQESIPQILSGYTYENDKPYDDYYTEAMNNSKLLNNLYDNKYEVNLYEAELFFNDQNALKISNVVNCNNDTSCNIDSVIYIKNQIKYVLFRYLPYSLKKYSRIESMNFANSLKIKNTELFYDLETSISFYYNNTPVDMTDNNSFKFIHLGGAHVPFTLNKNLEENGPTTYYDELEATTTVIKDYLEFLKKNNLYNNSKIIILSDHGYHLDENDYETIEGRQNPILFIKGKDETHKKMVESDKPISYDDLSDAYVNLINNKVSKDLFKNIPDERTRRFILYSYNDEKHMTEYETKDKAWETDKLYKTGKEFIRE